jgi:hypothetical protein
MSVESLTRKVRTAFADGLDIDSIVTIYGKDLVKVLLSTPDPPPRQSIVPDDRRKTVVEEENRRERIDWKQSWIELLQFLKTCLGVGLIIAWALTMMYTFVTAVRIFQ